jgi:hypothetical protein
VVVSRSVDPPSQSFCLGQKNVVARLLLNRFEALKKIVLSMIVEADGSNSDAVIEIHAFG